MLTRKQIKNRWKKYYLSGLLFVVFIAVYFLSNIFFISKNSNTLNEESSYTRSYGGALVNEENNLKYRNGSRLWIEYAQALVKKNKPTPPESARFYAYVASVYADALAVKGDNIQASLAVKEIINQIMSSDIDQTQKYFNEITGNSSELISPETTPIIKKYQDREKNDGKSSLIWDGIIPTGDGKWVGKNPLSPRAGEWTRWILDQNHDFETPLPPTYNSAEDKKELEIVTNAVKSRNDKEWLPKIEFWAGGPGTEAPLGIWLNRLYEETKNQKISDMQFARYQKILTQTVADAFMECWKVKFTYWTARPSMRMKKLSTTQNDPNFPSYLSGHSTISRAAAEVLSKMIPEKEQVWIDNAKEARDTRLVSGIHFQIDNDAGFDLGEKIGKQVISKIDITTY